MRTLINLNETVRVRLTARGREVVLAHLKALGREFLERGHAERLGVHGGWAEFQLWDLMHVFGPALTIGAGPVFESNEVELP